MYIILFPTAQWNIRFVQPYHEAMPTSTGILIAPPNSGGPWRKSFAKPWQRTLRVLCSSKVYGETRGPHLDLQVVTVTEEINQESWDNGRGSNEKFMDHLMPIGWTCGHHGHGGAQWTKKNHLVRWFYPEKCLRFPTTMCATAGVCFKYLETFGISNIT